MARVTIEDCVREIDNTFDICTLASKRAKDLASGATSSIESKNKPSVLALREIAEKKVGLDYFEISNKQIADSKLFSGINEQEIVEELSQQINSSDQIDSNITESALSDSSETKPDANEGSIMLEGEVEQFVTKESAAITSESPAITEESTQPDIPEDIGTDSPEK
tara:strand:- start:12339 stop:12836 length:498 start_codon:yes stop_codon:yes gene_type:complete